MGKRTKGPAKSRPKGGKGIPRAKTTVPMNQR